MMLLYAGPTGKSKVSGSSGQFEIDLIRFFKDDHRESYPNLQNKGDGGEHASSGCPHFTYFASLTIEVW